MKRSLCPVWTSMNQFEASLHSHEHLTVTEYLHFLFLLVFFPAVKLCDGPASLHLQEVLHARLWSGTTVHQHQWRGPTGKKFYWQRPCWQWPCWLWSTSVHFLNSASCGRKLIGFCMEDRHCHDYLKNVNYSVEREGSTFFDLSPNDLLSYHKGSLVYFNYYIKKNSFERQAHFSNEAKLMIR